MLTKRIISCLDVKDGSTVKGINFVNLVDMGDPVVQAVYYTQQKVDELVFLDISATEEKRKTLAQLVRSIAKAIDIPFTVGGGIASVADVGVLLENGADKISVNTAAVKNPRLIRDIAATFGSQCVVVAVDAKSEGDDSLVYLNGGRVPTKLKVRDWVKQAEELGAGEILLTSIDHDGTRNGFANSLTSFVASVVNIPVIASGGAGKMEHFKDVLTEGHADAALAAGIFHERVMDIPALKNYLREQNINVRL